MQYPGVHSSTFQYYPSTKFSTAVLYLLNLVLQSSREWPVITIQWPVTSDQWSGSDQWSVTSDQWSVISDQWPVTSDRWPVTSRNYKRKRNEFWKRRKRSKNPKLIWLSISIHDESGEMQNLISRILSDASKPDFNNNLYHPTSTVRRTNFSTCTCIRIYF